MNRGCGGERPCLHLIDGLLHRGRGFALHHCLAQEVRHALHLLRFHERRRLLLRLVLVLLGAEPEEALSEPRHEDAAGEDVGLVRAHGDPVAHGRGDHLHAALLHGTLELSLHHALLLELLSELGVHVLFILRLMCRVVAYPAGAFPGAALADTIARLALLVEEVYLLGLDGVAPFVDLPVGVNLPIVEPGDAAAHLGKAARRLARARRRSLPSKLGPARPRKR
mmetsp:Transcript_69166/g.218798  ORF Transcript_69166/g.218798 Transcript_69166/m.218798 type:complete len:224 (-) Transcript_69166:8-679(-)